MLNIKNYLEKFIKDVNSTELHKEQILNIIRENSEVQLSAKDIEIKDYILRVRSSPCVKNKLFVCKNRILNDISALAPDLKVVDIK